MTSRLRIKGPTISSMQEALLKMANPLDIVLGREFFTQIPMLPGVYRMLGDSGELLYVGKAKDLRARLMSYRRVKITEASTKTIRLVHQISQITWEICKSEEEALVKENALLREHKPPFNSANTKPETYFYFTVERFSDPTHFSLNLAFEVPEGNVASFGAFKGLAKCHRSFYALRRMLWWVSEYDESENFIYPLVHFRRQKLQAHEFHLSRQWMNLLAGFLHGFSYSVLQKESELVMELKLKLRGLDLCDAFHRAWIEADLETLSHFFKSGPTKNSRLKIFSKNDSATLEKNEVDDLIVRRRFSVNCPKATPLIPLPSGTETEDLK